MQKKPAIIIVIDDLRKGGAEMLLVGVLNDLTQRFNVVLVSLTSQCGFDESSFQNVTSYSLGIKNKLSYLKGLYRLKKIIRNHRPVLIHSHLVYSTILARLACPANIPFVFSVHGKVGSYVFKQSFILSFLEKITVAKNQHLVAVSKDVLDDYEHVIRFKGKKYLLENYIGDNFFQPGISLKSYQPGQPLKIVALGNIKSPKNYAYLVQSFTYLAGLPVSLDIYGAKDKKIFPELSSFIAAHNLPIDFKGMADDIPGVFSGYDIYVMSSSHEGFGIAAVEAMACRLPLLLSDIPVLKEVTHSNAIFFNLREPDALAIKIKEILAGKYDLEALSARGVEIAGNYNKRGYVEKLNRIYDQVLQQR